MYMKSLLLSAAVLSFMLLSCKHSLPNHQSETTANHYDFPVDSVERAFLDGKLFYSSFIRLHPKDCAYIYIDEEYINQLHNETTKQLFNTTEYLTAENREAYYQKMMSAIPKEDHIIFDRIWKLKEVREQISGDGGLHTLATWMTQKPTADDPFYYIEVRRLYLERFGICTGIGFVKVHFQSHKIFVANRDGEYLPLKEWRKIKDD